MLKIHFYWIHSMKINLDLLMEFAIFSLHLLSYFEIHCINVTTQYKMELSLSQQLAHNTHSMPSRAADLGQMVLHSF